MNLAWQNFWKHPQSTVTGILSAIVAAGLIVADQPALVGSVISPVVAAKIAGAAAVARLILGIMSKDTGREEAKVPDGSTQMVESHETPDNPKDVVESAR